MSKRWWILGIVAVLLSTVIPFAAAVQIGTGQVINVRGLSVRSGPYLGASRLAIIAPGRSYPILARNRAEGTYNWYQSVIQDIQLDAEGNEQPIGEPLYGWVSGRYFLIDVPEENVPELTSVFETLSPPSTGVGGVTISNLRLRRGPSYRTPTLLILDWGAELEILSRTIQANEDFWYQVRYDDGEADRIGWVYAPYVNPIGDIESVPAY